MSNNVIPQVVKLLKSRKIKKNTAKSLCLALMRIEVQMDSLNEPRANIYLDLAEALSLLASEYDISLVSKYGSKKVKEVKITHKNLLLSLILEKLNYYEAFRRDEDLENSKVDSYILVYDPDKKQELQARIKNLIDKEKKKQGFFDALAGRSEGWIPLMGYIAGRLDSILVEDQVNFKTLQDKYTLIFDLIRIFHFRVEETAKDKALAVNYWLTSFDKLEEQRKVEAQKILGKGNIDLDNIYSTYFDNLWKAQKA